MEQKAQELETQQRQDNHNRQGLEKTSGNKFEVFVDLPREITLFVENGLELSSTP